VFSASDGSFVASSDLVTLPPGEYILVQQWDLFTDRFPRIWVPSRAQRDVPNRVRRAAKSGWDW